MTTEHQSPSGREALRIIDTIELDFDSVPAHTAPDAFPIAVPGSKVGDAVIVTPLGTWPAGLAMQPNRIEVAGTLQLRLVNPTVGNISPASQVLRLAIFRFLRTGADRNSPSGRIQKLTSDVVFDFANVAASTAVDQAVAVPGALIGDTILVTPLGMFPEGLLLGGPHRCLADGVVQVRITNVTAGSINPVSQTLRFTLFRNARGPDRQSPSGREQRRDVDVAVDVANIDTITAPDFPVVVPSARVGDCIIVTPLMVNELGVAVASFDDGLGMGPHRCLVAGTVQMRIGNVTVAPIDVVSRIYRFSLIRF